LLVLVAGPTLLNLISPRSDGGVGESQWAGRSISSAYGQQPDQPDAGRTAEVGWRINVPLPITPTVVQGVLEQLTAVAGTSPGVAGVAGARRTVMLAFETGSSDGSKTQFEDALRLARALARPEYRTLRLVGYVQGDLRGHAVLPLLACDTLIVGTQATIGDATAGDGSGGERGGDSDETIVGAYRAVAARRGLIPATVAEALVRPSIELVQATTLDGKRQFATGEELQELRRGGGGWREDVWAVAGEPLVMNANRLRDARIAANVVPSIESGRQALGLAELRSVGQRMLDGEPVGVLLDIQGVISPDRVRRWELNLITAADRGEVNLWMVSVDSPGGNLGASVQLAGTLSSISPPIRRTIGYVPGRTLADSPVIALACRPLYLHPDATLGGPGAVTLRGDELVELEEAIDRIATDAARPSALIRGLLDPTLAVHLYTHRRTGEIRYAAVDDLPGGAEGEEEPNVWQRGERIELDRGIGATRAIELGLAEGLADSVADAATQAGLAGPPPPLANRGIVHFVEWIGSLSGVAILLLLIGLLTLSVEVGAPGLSFPGFISMICFTLYFWIQFLNGTAQWLEILAFVLGIVCIAIEVFLLPGIGVFGIGGLLLLVIGVVLTSQTFVIPRNAYQYEQLTRNLWLVLAGGGAVIGGLALLKLLLPQTRFMRELALEAPDEAILARTERMADFEHLTDQVGIAATPLMPSGRVRFGEEWVQVVTDGSPVSAGKPVRVIQVLGNRVIVAPLDEDNGG